MGPEYRGSTALIWSPTEPGHSRYSQCGKGFDLEKVTEKYKQKLECYSQSFSNVADRWLKGVIDKGDGGNWRNWKINVTKNPGSYSLRIYSVKRQLKIWPWWQRFLPYGSVSSVFLAGPIAPFGEAVAAHRGWLGELQRCTAGSNSSFQRLNVQPEQHSEGPTCWDQGNISNDLWRSWN